MRKTLLNKKNKNLGRSQFIREKLEEEYNPKVRIKTEDQSPYEIKKKYSLIGYQEREKVSDKTVSSVKGGKKILIDWTTKTNFRTTKFPDISDGKTS